MPGQGTETARPRVRFAPSPTGMLHIGGARTALFNWLFARRHGGTLVLRIEDTDAARDTPEAREAILGGLRWLGIDWDEGPGVGGPHGPYLQSARRDVYGIAVARLVGSGAAYERDGAVWLRMPQEPCEIDDAICGRIGFRREGEPDVVLQRADGTPVFHLVNVVDDIAMGITHVIRGQDHLSNTPRHLAIYAALGARPPRFAHMPLILNADGTKMSKRDAGAAVADYIRDGYCPSAVRNYIGLLGWSPGDGREIMGIGEMVEAFDLAGVNRSNARFDRAKLDWMNGAAMRAMAPAEYRAFVGPVLRAAGLDPGPPGRVDRALEMVRERVRVARDLPGWLAPLLGEAPAPPADLAARLIAPPACRERLRRIRSAVAALDEFTEGSIGACFAAAARATGAKTGDFVHPCRAALCGSDRGPGLYATMEFLGRDACLARLDAAIGRRAPGGAGFPATRAARAPLPVPGEGIAKA